MTILQAIKSLSRYPIADTAIELCAIKRGLDVEDEVTDVNIAETSYKLLEADIYLWLASAPTVTQGGISYSFSEKERNLLKQKASAIYTECGVDGAVLKYGYKGSTL